MNNKHSIYLLIDEDKFKVGYSQNPFQRAKQYKTHNCDATITAVFYVNSKDVENSVHMELLKRGYKSTGQPDWFWGTLSGNELQEILNILDYKRKLCGLDQFT